MLAEQSLLGLHIREASLPGLWCGEYQIDCSLMFSKKKKKDHMLAHAPGHIDIAGESFTPGGSQWYLGVSDRGVTHARESLTPPTTVLQS